MRENTVRKIIGTSIKDKTQVCFDGTSAAADYLHLDNSHIAKCLSGKRRSHGGYTWAYKYISVEKSEKLLEVKKEAIKQLGDLANSDKVFSDLKFSQEKWCAEEDTVIRDLYPKGNLNEIVKKISRDVPSITLRAKVLGLDRKVYHHSKRSSQDLVNIVVELKEETMGDT